MNFAPLIRSAIATMKANLAARIAIYNAEAANLHDLIVPATAASDAQPNADGDYWFGGNDAHFRFPAIEVAIPGPAVLSNPDLYQNAYDLAATVMVAVWLEGETGEIPELYEKALGYGRCVMEVLTEPDAFGGSVGVRRITATFPTIPQGAMNPETRSFDKWRTLAVLEFELDEIARAA